MYGVHNTRDAIVSKLIIGTLVIMRMSCLTSIFSIFIKFKLDPYIQAFLIRVISLFRLAFFLWLLWWHIRIRNPRKPLTTYTRIRDNLILDSLCLMISHHVGTSGVTHWYISWKTLSLQVKCYKKELDILEERLYRYKFALHQLVENILWPTQMPLILNAKKSSSFLAVLVHLTSSLYVETVMATLNNFSILKYADDTIILEHLQRGENSKLQTDQQHCQLV